MDPAPLPFDADAAGVGFPCLSVYNFCSSSASIAELASSS
jgi:hypothetical protein